jgi:hypothetical protein
MGRDNNKILYWKTLTDISSYIKKWRINGKNNTMYMFTKYYQFPQKKAIKELNIFNKDVFFINYKK